ncbi:MAG: helix-turn-helix transcriptional regulator [Pseudomonadota bacterium]
MTDSKPTESAQPLPRLNLGRALKRWRILNAVKQQALAEHFGVSQVTISRWKHGAFPERRYVPAIQNLIEARPSNQSDRALARLVETSNEPFFLICDVTHKLLAASPRRAQEWHQPVRDLLGTSLWRYATEEIDRVEQEMCSTGWFDDPSSERVFYTSQADYDEISITAGHRKVVRVPLSDGRFARLVNDY